MKAQLSVVTLGVRDLDAAYNFYVDGLGWTAKAYVADEVAFFQVGPGLLLSLFRVDHLAAEAGGIGHGALAPPVTLSHNVDSRDEVDFLIGAAVAAGAELVAPGTAMSWGGYSGYFADPDGFRWEVCHNPGLEIADNGDITMTDVS